MIFCVCLKTMFEWNKKVKKKHLEFTKGASALRHLSCHFNFVSHGIALKLTQIGEAPHMPLQLPTELPESHFKAQRNDSLLCLLLGGGGGWGGGRFSISRFAVSRFAVSCFAVLPYTHYTSYTHQLSPCLPKSLKMYYLYEQLQMNGNESDMCLYHTFPIKICTSGV